MTTKQDFEQTQTLALCQYSIVKFGSDYNGETMPL